MLPTFSALGIRALKKMMVLYVVKRYIKKCGELYDETKSELVKLEQ
jgi:hypothetical protein